MSHRVVEPVQLLFKEYTWYLRAWCREREAMRIFKVLRMKRVETTGEIFVPEALSTPTAVAQSTETSQAVAQSTETSQVLAQLQEASQPVAVAQTEECQEIVLHIEASEAYRVHDRFEEAETTIQEDGSFLVHICYRLINHYS